MPTNKKHILFWVIIYVAWTFMKSSGGGNIGMYLIINLVNIPIFMAAFYFLKHYQLPYLYNQKKWILFIISMLFSTFTLYFIWRIAGVLWFDCMRNLEGISFMRFDRYLVYAVQFYSPGLLLLAWEMQEEKRIELERLNALTQQKLETELKFLKSQLNPHFLFNTFNNLYSLVITGNPKAPNMILQLSSILEFVLYKSQLKTVALTEEIDVVQKYIELEKIRYGDHLNIETVTEGNLANPVAPLLILSLVENAFKHGASTDLDNPTIKINIKSKQHQIKVSIWNSKSSHKGESKDIHKEGLGLKNINRQLELQYPNMHTLTIFDRENNYEVSLIINVTDA